MEQFTNGSRVKRKERRGKFRRQEVDQSQNSYAFSNDSSNHNIIWSNQSQLNAQRTISTGDTTFGPYPLHVGYPMEPMQFSLYPSVYPVATAPYCPTPPARKGRKNNYSGIRNESQVPPVGVQQYTSLPPSNCETFSPKSSDSETNSKRHYSDPGLGYASSVDSDESLSTFNPAIYKNLLEEMRDVKEKCRLLSSELIATKQDLRNLQLDGCNKCSVAYTPGSITDAVSEIRLAALAREDALLGKFDSRLNSFEDLQNKTLKTVNSRLAALEEQLPKVVSKEVNASVGTEELPFVTGREVVAVPAVLVHQPAAVADRLAKTAAPDAFQMLRDLEEQKSNLEKELQEALLGRVEAEAHSQKLERHVAILKTKINGLSVESCIDDKVQGPVIQSGVQFRTNDDTDTHSKVGGGNPTVVTILPTSTVITQLQVKPSDAPSKIPPSVPPRPSAFSPPHRPRTTPPARPLPSPNSCSMLGGVSKVSKKSGSTDSTKPMTSARPKSTSVIPPVCVPKTISEQFGSSENSTTNLPSVIPNNSLPLSPANLVVEEISSIESIESSSEGLSSETSSLTPVLTISGPVTDL